MDWNENGSETCLGRLPRTRKAHVLLDYVTRDSERVSQTLSVWIVCGSSSSCLKFELLESSGGGTMTWLLLFLRPASQNGTCCRNEGIAEERPRRIQHFL